MPNNKAGTVFGHAPRMGPPLQSPSLATTIEAALHVEQLSRIKRS
jgi:hypothetical protein